MSTVVPADSVKLSITTNALSPGELRKMNAYWRAANYLSVGQIYLYANPLLREPLKFEYTKPRLLGHWGTTPGRVQFRPDVPSSGITHNLAPEAVPLIG